MLKKISEWRWEFLEDFQTKRKNISEKEFLCICYTGLILIEFGLKESNA